MVDNIINLATKHGFIRARVANLDNKSFLVLALPYQIATKSARKYFGLFACHDNYKHTVNKCKDLRKDLATLFNVPAKRLRIVCNGQGVNEKQLASSCGLGFYGKNSLIIIDEWGSFFSLSLIELAVNLESHEPLITTNIVCHDCNLCQKSCPHGALIEPYSLNTANCEQEWISRGYDNSKITKVYGCDKCQNCCPYNKVALTYYNSKADKAKEEVWTNLDNWRGKNISELEIMLKHTLLGYRWLSKEKLLKNVDRILIRQDNILNKKW